MRTIPLDNLSYATQIIIDSGIAGSGYFVKTKSKLFLVTAKHVLFNENDELLGDLTKIINYSKNIEENSTIEYEVSLKLLHSSGSILTNDKDDVAVIYWGVLHPQGFAPDSRGAIKLTKFKPEDGGAICAELHNIKRLQDVHTGNDVYIIGYPISIGLQDVPQIDYDKPLIRKGIVAGKNVALNTIVLDCEVYPGNSGGIVLQMEYESSTIINYKVIGTISQFVPFKATIIGENESKAHAFNNSGYSIIVPCDPVLDLIEGHSIY